MFEDETKYYLNAKEQQEFTTKDCAEEPTGFIQIGIKAQDEHQWMIGFEKQSDTNVYCRTYIDLID